MLRAIKIDLFRLFKTKITYILLGVTVLFSAFMMLTYGFLEFSLKLFDAETLGAETIALIESTVPKNFDGYISMFFYGNYSIVFLLLFAVLFCNAEYKTGYIKNTVANIQPRYVTYFSKLIIITGYAIVTFLLIFLVVLGGCAILGHLEVENLFGLVKMLIVQLLCNISLTTFIMMIYYVTRTTSAAMIGGLVYATMGTILFTLVNLLFSVAFPGKDIDITKFTNLGNMVYHVGIDASVGTLVRAVVVAVVFIGISSFFSCLSINKKDIR